MVRNLIGTVTTDSNGEATFTYTGRGLGRIGFSAEHGTFQSETYDVLDALFIDDGTSDKSSSWALNSASYSQSNNCITLSNSTGSNKSISAKVEGSSSGYIDNSKDYCVEVDIKNIDATTIRIYLDNSFIDVKNYVDTSNFSSIKIYTNRAENKLYYEINGTTNSKSLDTPSGNVGLRIGNNESYQFKNYKLYLI